MNTDNLSLFFSLVAIVISIVALFVEYKRDYRINSINLEAEYFSDIYKKHLIINIPYARREICFIGNKLSGTNRMISLLKEILQDSYYYNYKDKIYYDALKDRIQSFEDYLCENTGQTFDCEEQTDVLNKIRKYIEDIYECICNHLIGK